MSRRLNGASSDLSLKTPGQVVIAKENISGFEEISLQEMGKVRLMNRIDTKYVTHASNILKLLALAKEDYRVQTIEDEANLPYYTCYYDTSDVDMYYQHQRGKKNRQKIRWRLYEKGGVTPFLEIKTKNNRGRTKKKRVEMDRGFDLDGYADFLTANCNYEIRDLQPKIENHFYRVTLVNHDMTERITIDTGIEFHNFTTDLKVSMPEVGVIEWKREDNGKESPLKDILLRLRIREEGFSKYCIGMAITDPSLRHNRIKKRLRLIERVTRL